MEIRRARLDDAEAIALVQHRGWLVGYAHVFPEERLRERTVGHAERWRRNLADPELGRTTFVAEQDGGVVGFATIGPSRDGLPDGELYAIYVEPDAWGRGVGRALIETAEAALAGEGYAEATLWVLEDNPRARRFYEAAGWSCEEARKLEVHLDTLVAEVRYRKRLARASV